jgi:tetratricopeptide (TPR) repeat protein
VLTNQTIDPNQTGQSKPFILFRPFVMVWHWLVPPTQAHKDRQSPAARWAAWIGVTTFCAGSMGLAIYFARPMHDRYQDWQAEKMVKESRQMAEDGQIVSAVLKAQEAVKIAPENINAIRLNTEFLTSMRRPEALYFLDKLDRSGNTELADKQTRVKALMNLNREKEAASLLEEVLAEDPSNPLTMKLAEIVWGSSQKNSVLLKTLKSYAEKQPEDAAHSLRLAKVQAESTDAAERGEGMRRAWEVAGREDALGLQALEFLNSFEYLPPDESKRLIEKLRSHPKATGWHIAAALTRQLRLDPARKTNLVQEAVQMAQGKSREDLVPIIRWLVEQQQGLQVLALVSEQEAIAYQPLLENYLTALTMLQRFDDLERMVKDPKIDAILNQSVSAFYRAHLAFVMRKPPEEVRSALILAKNAADLERRGELCIKIAEYAEARGHADIAEDAYQSAALNPRTDRLGYQGLIRATEANENTEGLLAAATEAVRRWPDDPVYAERFLYANLLTGRQMELTLNESLKLLDVRPEDPFRRLLTALAYWRLMDFKAATPHLQNMDISRLSAGQKAMFAAIARDSVTDNAAQAARDVINSIEGQSRMLPEERAGLARATR